MVDEHLDARRGRKRRLPGEHPVRDTTQAIQVGPPIDLLVPIHRLGRYVARGPEEHPGLADRTTRVRRDLFGEPEVEHLDVVVE